MSGILAKSENSCCVHVVSYRSPKPSPFSTEKHEHKSPSHTFQFLYIADRPMQEGKEYDLINSSSGIVLEKIMIYTSLA